MTARLLTGSGTFTPSSGGMDRNALISSMYGNPPPVKKPAVINPFSPGTAQAAQETNADDYDSIMGAYKNLQNTSSRAPTQQMSYTPITPRMHQYNPSSEFSSAMSTVRGLTESGGYTPSDIQAIRARAVSPIRSIYSSANRNINRQRTLQGGYSPNYTAASVKMAREMSEQLGEANTNVEAGLAETISKNRMQAAGMYAPLAAEESRLRSSVDMANVDSTNRANETNRLMPLQYAQFNNDQAQQNWMQQMQAIEGMRSMYGTTPALSSTFGNQVLQSQSLNDVKDERKANRDDERTRLGLGFASQYGRGRF